MKIQRRVEVYLYTFFNFGARWGWVVNATLRPIYPRERPGTHCIGGWVAPQGLSGQVRKNLPSPGFDPRTVQPVASRYTDWGIPGPTSGSMLVLSWCMRLRKLSGLCALVSPTETVCAFLVSVTCVTCWQSCVIPSLSQHRNWEHGAMRDVIFCHPGILFLSTIRSLLRTLVR